MNLHWNFNFEVWNAIIVQSKRHNIYGYDKNEYSEKIERTNGHWVYIVERG